MIVDAHTHLWKRQNGLVNGKPVFSTGGGMSNFGGEMRLMTPPYMLNGENTAEMLIANMDYAQVNCAVVTQEYIDGSQDDYLRDMNRLYGGRIKTCSLFYENSPFQTDGFDGIKICAGRLKNPDLTKCESVFEAASKKGKFISVDLAEGDKQLSALRELAKSYPNVKIAVGHFGMVGRSDWKEQIKLARLDNIYIESGGITWLFNDEFYPYRGAVRAILEAAELVGIEKLMWGSDYPRTMTAITYKMSLGFVTDSDMLTEYQKARFIGENAAKFYGFPEMKPLPLYKNMVQD